MADEYEGNMKCYAASNFILLRYLDKEKAFREHISRHYGECGRLYSYFFTREIAGVLKMMKEENKDKIGNNYENK